MVWGIIQRPVQEAYTLWGLIQKGCFPLFINDDGINLLPYLNKDTYYYFEAMVRTRTRMTPFYSSYFL